MKQFYQAIREGRYVDAAEFLPSDFFDLDEIQEEYPELDTREKLREWWGTLVAEEYENAHGIPIRIEIVEEEIEEDGMSAYLYVTEYYPDGTSGEVHIDLVNEDGIWKGN